MKPERQLGLLWGGVAALLLALSPLAGRLASAMPACPVKTLSGLPCLTCGSTRAALALAHFDLAGAVAANPLAALAWLVLVGGGLMAGLLAALNVPLREPEWVLARSTRWFLVSTMVANWIYLVEAGA